MTTFLAMLVLSCLGNVAPGLQVLYCQAAHAWAPYQANIRRVKWCDPGECSEMGGGMFHYDSRVIAIDPDWPFEGNDLLLTIEHEYGHALGLQHRWSNSIMKPGWDQPSASGPTDDDFKELERIYGARVH
jgi:matrixin